MCMCVFFMKPELILTELRPFELSCFWQLFLHLGYGVCAINFSYSFQWVFLKLCRHIVNILELCMCVFDGARIDFDRIDRLGPFELSPFE